MLPLCVPENWNKWNGRSDEIESQQNEYEDPHCEDPDFNVSEIKLYKLGILLKK
jgi:hypothetical protein